MLKKLLELLASKGDFIDVSRENILSMLSTSKEMFDLVYKSLDQQVDYSIKKGISKIDRQLNDKKRVVRQMVYEHLAISGASDLLKSIQFFSIVSDIERIGDYVKNLAEVLDYIPKKLVINEPYQKRFHQMVTGTKKMFEKTEKAVKDFNDSEATDAIVKYQNLSSICESIIEDIIKSNGDTVSKSDVRLLMMARYTKRVNAHLKNVAETLKNPLQTISKTCTYD